MSNVMEQTLLVLIGVWTVVGLFAAMALGALINKIASMRND